MRSILEATLSRDFVLLYINGPLLDWEWVLYDSRLHSSYGVPMDVWILGYI